MKYRGFNLVATYADKISKFDHTVWGNVPGYCCQAFSEKDDCLCHPLGDFELLLGSPLKSLDEDEVEEWMTREADRRIDDWKLAETHEQLERKNELLGRLVCHLGECEHGLDLYLTLHDGIGFTDDEIRECGFDSLTEYFDRPALAQSISEWLIKEGTEQTSSGNWIVEYSEVNARFGVNLNEDKYLLDCIIGNLENHEAMLDVITGDDAFDMNFGLRYCPYADENEGLTM